MIPSQEDSNSNDIFGAGHTLQVSESCNSDFIHDEQFKQFEQLDCEKIKHFGGCGLEVNVLIFLGHWNTHGHLETFLQCPQCGCGSEGAANLNDLYAAEQDGSRKVSDLANTIFNEPLQ